MDAQRHAEYYGMQRTFDELYAKSKAGETFTGLMELVLSPDNIMLAYRNIKTNTGSYTAGTDKQNIGDIGRLPPAEVIGKVRKIVTGSEHGYRPKPKRQNQAAGYPLHLGQIGAAMHQTNPGAHLRGKVQQQQLWVPPESVSGTRNFPYLLPAATGALTLCFGV